jgi:hypothetical protein
MNALGFEALFMAFCFVCIFLVTLFLVSFFLGDVFGMFRLGLMKFPEGCGVLGTFLGRIGCKFRATSRAAGFHFFGFLFGKRCDLFGMNFSGLFGFFLFIGKFGAAN